MNNLILTVLAVLVAVKFTLALISLIGWAYLKLTER